MLAVYRRLWREVPRSLGFLLPGLPLALVGFLATSALVAAGAGTIVTVVLGGFFAVAALYVGRGFATVELQRLAWSGMPPISMPDWGDRSAREGFWAWLGALIGNGHYWLALLHTLIVSVIVAFVSWTVTVLWLVVPTVGLTSWLWHWAGQGQGVLAGSLGDGPNPALESVLLILLGLAFLAALPLVTTGFVRVHWLIARGMLGAFRSDALRREVEQLGASRGAAVAAEGSALRRLERDIHDGPQQRLVRIQMDLASAERQLGEHPDPVAARRLVGEAMQQSREALEELRALSRGFAPPILLDRGLLAALDSAATRSPVPTCIVDALPPGLVLHPEVERGAYFVASEALTNVAKHSGAGTATVTLGVTRAPGSRTPWLDVVVEDDGRGGASLQDGHGLAGLDERVRGLGGVLRVSSPPGGPTVVLTHIPLAW